MNSCCFTIVKSSWSSNWFCFVSRYITCSLNSSSFETSTFSLFFKLLLHWNKHLQLLIKVFVRMTHLLSFFKFLMLDFKYWFKLLLSLYKLLLFRLKVLHLSFMHLVLQIASLFLQTFSLSSWAVCTLVLLSQARSHVFDNYSWWTWYPSFDFQYPWPFLFNILGLERIVVVVALLFSR